MTTYTSPTVTYIRELDEFRVSAHDGHTRSTVGTCCVGGKFSPASPAFADAGAFAIVAVNKWLRENIKIA